MSERRYSFREVEAMRAALAMGYPCGVSYSPAERSREIEDRIRTYMAGNVDPQEVIDGCRKSGASSQGMPGCADYRFSGGEFCANCGFHVREHQYGRPG